jgi:hypothetical protein
LIQDDLTPANQKTELNKLLNDEVRQTEVMKDIATLEHSQQGRCCFGKCGKDYSGFCEKIREVISGHKLCRI